MTYVWVVSVGWDYEGDDVAAVCASEESAAACVARLIDEERVDHDRCFAEVDPGRRWEAGSKRIYIDRWEVES